MLERPTVSSRVNLCPRGAGVGDSDGTEAADGAGEEADFKSFILERHADMGVWKPF